MRLEQHLLILLWVVYSPLASCYCSNTHRMSMQATLSRTCELWLFVDQRAKTHKQVYFTQTHLDAHNNNKKLHQTDRIKNWPGCIDINEQTPLSLLCASLTHLLTWWHFFWSSSTGTFPFPLPMGSTLAGVQLKQ